MSRLTAARRSYHHHKTKIPHRANHSPQDQAQKDFHKAIHIVKKAGAQQNGLVCPLDFYVCRALTAPSNFAALTKWHDFIYAFRRAKQAVENEFHVGSGCVLGAGVCFWDLNLASGRMPMVFSRCLIRSNKCCSNFIRLHSCICA